MNGRTTTKATNTEDTTMATTNTTRATVKVAGERLQAGTRVLLDGREQVVLEDAQRDAQVITVRFDGYGPYTFGALSGQRFDVIVEPGTPATFGIGSDRYAQRVTGVGRVRADGRALEVEVDGTLFTWRERFQRYAQKGSPARGGGTIVLGWADEYMDPSF